MVSVRLMGFPPFGVGPAPLACLYYIIGIALYQEVFQRFFVFCPGLYGRGFLFVFAFGYIFFDEVFYIAAFVGYAFQLFNYFRFRVYHHRKAVPLHMLRLPFFDGFRACFGLAL